MTAEAKDGDLTPESERERFIQEVVWPATSTLLILDAFRRVDRRLFVPEQWKASAYQDIIIPLGEGASLSQPSLMAMMMDHLGLDGKGKVLEVGTGSGYGAALLSKCARIVFTVEYDETLTQKAQERLKFPNYHNIGVFCRDGALGLPERTPFNSIIVTAAARKIPQALWEQLTPDGYLVIPIGRDWQNSNLLVARKSSPPLFKFILPVRFYPLISPADGGWTENQLQKLSDLRLQVLRREAENVGESLESFLEKVAAGLGAQEAPREQILEICLRGVRLSEKDLDTAGL